jgi:hypothetical protein
MTTRNSRNEGLMTGFWLGAMTMATVIGVILLIL